MKEKKHVLSLALVGVVFVPLTLAAWFVSPKAFSMSERRKLAQRPMLTLSSVVDGSFMADFDKYAQDQFPLRDAFRTLKAVATYDLLQQRENNGIYIQDGYAAKLDYPLDEASIMHATDRFAYIYEHYLAGKNTKIYLLVVPDKSYFLAAPHGYPSMDYEKMIARVREEMRYADYIDITGTLDITDYYRTDTHWRQERLLDTAATLIAGMGADSSVSGMDATDTGVSSTSMHGAEVAATLPEVSGMGESDVAPTSAGMSLCSAEVGASSLMASDMNEGGVCAAASGIAHTTSYELNALDRPFYGVYYGQSALPLPPETLYYLTNETLEHCVVTNHETGAVGGIYDMDAAAGRDPYEIFLSGARPLITIENPNAAGAKELIIFRDSFGSSIAPLLVDGYRKVTLVDIRYLRTDFLDRFIDFDGQDILFLYSTSVLNHSETLT